jgi:hypothetical protein
MFVTRPMWRLDLRVNRIHTRQRTQREAYGMDDRQDGSFFFFSPKYIRAYFVAIGLRRKDTRLNRYIICCFDLLVVRLWLCQPADLVALSL